MHGLKFKLWMDGKVAPKEDCNHWEMEKLATDPNILMICWLTNIQIFKYSTNKYSNIQLTNILMICRLTWFHINLRPDMQNIVCGWEENWNALIFSSLSKEQPR